ncbi:MAG: hypothetical protein WCL90_13155 [Planctomycetota bacterium]|nr:hypothetical protein [Gemmataceae bacterium]
MKTRNPSSLSKPKRKWLSRTISEGRILYPPYKPQAQAKAALEDWSKSKRIFKDFNKSANKLDKISH